MKKLVCKSLYVLGAAVVALQVSGSAALAVDTMADWAGQNSNPANTTFQTVTFANNYGLITPTSVGGTIQSKINYSTNPASPAFEPSISDVNAQNIYFSDPTIVDGAGDPLLLDFTTPLHMQGTVTFASPTDTEPNILFGWYSSINTAHRIGLGISNRAAGAPGGAIANSLRIDFGYAATGGNSFHYVSTDGAQPADSVNSVVPNGTYPFTFDYTPGPLGMAGGMMSATVGTFFKTVQPLTTQPWDTDFFSFDRFGFVQRATGSLTNNPTNTYNVVFSNVDYTGGTEGVASVPGDFNSSGAVNAADLTIWGANYGTGNTLALGDANGDGDVDGDDFLIWQRNVSGAPVAAIPEPTSFLLLAGAAFGLAVRWRRACR